MTSPRQMVVALDAMGGDHAPTAPLEGALDAVAGADVAVMLLGDREVIEAEMARLGGVPPGLTLVHAPDAIEMGERAAREVRSRRESSIYRGMELVKSGLADAFVSAGNTGAVLATALVVLGRLRGCDRPALGAVLPLPTGPMLLIDAGANAESRAAHLVQWAHLGAGYMHSVYGVAEPRVGLLNIGEEASKGVPEAVEAHALLSASALRFVGNVEGRGLMAGQTDVVVTDGFTGNVTLKVIEGTVSMMFRQVGEVARSSLRARVGGMLVRPALLKLRGRFDYREYGAVPLVGVDGTVFVAHGSSDRAAIAAAVRSAAEAARRGVVDALRAAGEQVAGEQARGRRAGADPTGG